MLNFKEFDWRDENHQALAEEGVDVIFYEDCNPVIRFGYLYEKEHGDYTKMDYRVLSKTLVLGSMVEFDASADGLHFCVINQGKY